MKAQSPTKVILSVLTIIYSSIGVYLLVDEKEDLLYFLDFPFIFVLLVVFGGLSSGLIGSIIYLIKGKLNTWFKVAVAMQLVFAPAMLLNVLSRGSRLLAARQQVDLEIILGVAYSFIVLICAVIALVTFKNNAVRHKTTFERPVSKGYRFVSHVLDYPVVVLFSVLFPNIMTKYVDSGVLIFFFSLAAYLYGFFIQEWVFGQTIGKIVFGLSVQILEDRPRGKVLFQRNLSRLIPFEPLSIIPDREGLTWHDSISKTIVVKRAIIVEKTKKGRYVPPSEKVNILSEEEALQYE